MQNNSFFLFILLVMVLSVVMDWYAFEGVKTLTARWKSQAARTVAHWGYWLVFIGLTVAVVFTFFTLAASHGFTPFNQKVFSLFITFFFTKLVLTIVLLAEDIYRVLRMGVAYLRQTFGSGKNRGSLLPARRKFISQTGLLLAGIPFFSFIHGMAKGKYRYRVHRQTLYFEDLPESFDGFTITQISDIHSGSFDDPEAVQRGIELIKAQHSDLFVFTGDLVNTQAREIEPWLRYFSQIKAPFGQFSILGNHDYGKYARWESEREEAADLEVLKRHHSTLGYRLLLNEHVNIEKNGQKISLLGVENWGVGFGKKGDLEKALNGIEEEAFKILLSHDPSHWEEEVKSHPSKLHLTLSGHTHGMQFGIEAPGFRWSPVQYRYPNWAGLASENDRYLYVNRGFGFNGFSGRVGIWPEITVLELRRGHRKEGLLSSNS
jgi:uncharacterized protein